MGKPTTNALLWVDIESTGLDPVFDSILEVGAILTDLDLVPISGYHEVIKPDRMAIERLRGAHDVVLSMHKESGLIKDMRTATVSLAEAEAELVRMVTATAFDYNEISLAGSGVAHFDRRVITHQMKDLDKWLTYYSYDIGVFRRMATLFNHGQQVIPPVRESYMEGFKAHRAWADVSAHLAEAKKFKDWVAGRTVPLSQQPV
jgi:oligoribonuclease